MHKINKPIIRSERLNYWLTAVFVVVFSTISFGPRQIGNGEFLGFGRAFLFGIILVAAYTAKMKIDSKTPSLFIHILTTYFLTLFLFIIVIVTTVSSNNILTILIGAAIFAVVPTAAVMLIPILIRYINSIRRR
ncbi:MAG: hypothetical protein WCW66_03915 [Patescibacteria group bacterium]